MQLLLKAFTIADPRSEFNGESRDILVERGKITKIAKRIKATDDIIVRDGQGAFLSPGWCDMLASFGDPGDEHKEDFESGIKAAAAGGFTAVCLTPDTNPPRDSKSGIEYVLKNSNNSLVDLHPYGALSEKAAGKNIGELHDMHRSGAIAFCDSPEHAANAGLQMRGLQYVLPFKGVIIGFPYEPTLTVNGMMHEGPVSTGLGLSGIPALSEDVVISRDIDILKYTDSRLHVAYVSTAEGVDMIRAAKKQGLNITCGVSAASLAFTDKALEGYETEYKVIPPLRDDRHQKALWKGLQDGTIDVISSGHRPQDQESKECEFIYAKFGMASLQTVLNMALQGNPKLGAEIIAEKLAINPRRILDLECSEIEEGALANLTAFDLNSSGKLILKNYYSKGKNNPMINREVKGKVLGIINGVKNRWYD